MRLFLAVACIFTAKQQTELHAHKFSYVSNEMVNEMKKLKKEQLEKISAKPKASVDAKKKEQQAPQEEELASWEDFEEITKGNFNKLLGCG